MFLSSELREHSHPNIFSFSRDLLSNEIASHLVLMDTISVYHCSINRHKIFIIKTFQNQKINDELMEMLCSE
jgi:hypothetical protein